ncbi:MAG: hypothetical protein MUC29_12145 [Pyrinomonadaceae bacterium]|jgi:tRNA U55 pseudouridine synthase TruB|nr:hypothetical protein [Pyrinomonadaceae bacterium]
MSDFIPFIHNYCDRWCERCTFSSRCVVFAKEQELTDAEKDIENEAYWRNIANNFAEATQMLKQMAEERGIDLDAIDYDEIEAERKLKREKVVKEELTKLTRDYYKQVSKLLETDSLFTQIDEQTRQEMFAIIYWYQYFISAKLQRALNSVDDDNFDEDFLRDCDGSAKIALIAIERSIMAWTNLINQENFTQIKPTISLLNKIKQITKEKFPNAMDFIRPGFDEIEIVM